MGMDHHEITKVIDGVYKNILDNFNPASREMIATGKAYLKALHGASAASSLYLDSLFKLSKQAEDSSLGCSADIGSSLTEVAQVFKEIHTQQLSALKAFYVDFLVPLEANLERDSRVIQNEQKRFVVSQKRRIEGFVKAASNAKKMKKKGRKSTSSTAIDKEIRVMQELEEEKAKLELFCENSLNTALTEERRRYGFILERQASLAKHYLAYYSKGNTLISGQLEEWMNVGTSREVLPNSMQNKLINRIQKGSEDDCIYCTPGSNSKEDCESSQKLHKSKSMEAAELLDDLVEEPRMGALSRAKSELCLIPSNSVGQFGGNHQNVGQFTPSIASTMGNRGVHRSESLAISTDMGRNSGVVKALYAYLSSGDNQLSFLEGDIIILIGERSRGWQYGENLRTQTSGWFPVAYTEEKETPAASPMIRNRAIEAPLPPPPPPAPPAGLLTPYHPPKGPGALTNQIVSASTQTPTGNSSGRASDSPNSSNDSGFSNDIHKVVPAQPEIDYSEDEPHSSSETLKSGDDWLMKKYHQSESARIKQAAKQPRRALSFINISDSAKNEEDNRGRTLTRRPRTTRHNSTSSQRSDGPLKKLLNRTKSLIWKKGASPPGQVAHGSAPPAHAPRPVMAFDSISDVGSEESDGLWGTHTSLVQLSSRYAPRRPPPSVPVKETGRACAESQIPKEPIKMNQHSQTDDAPKEPPPLPPLPPPLPWRGARESPRGKENGRGLDNGRNRNESGRSKNEYSNESVHGQRIRPPPPAPPSTSGPIRRTESEKIRKSFGAQRILHRVESFSGSEAPIVPNTTRMRIRANGQPTFSSRASMQSTNLEEEDHFMDDGQSSVFIETLENDDDFPPPPPPIREAENSHEPITTLPKRRSFIENSKGSLRLLGRRLKSQSLRIVPNESEYGTGTSEAGIEPKMNYNLERSEVRRRSSRRLKGAIRSEVHTLELIASESDGGSMRGPMRIELPLFEYGRQIQKRLYYPERNSKLDQKSERTGNLCGPWYDLWGIDPSVTKYSHAK